MNILVIVIGAAVLLLAAYYTYGTFLTKRVFQLDDSKSTPAKELNDGLDFVPAKKSVLFGEHFSAIAAAGPINGPILATLLFGWVPALIWVIIGSVFIGGVHDMGSLVASVRHKARSITYIIQKHVSHRAWVIFMLFVWITLIYIIIAFTDITASSFVGAITLETGEMVTGGAIASSSVMYLILPVIMGLLLRFTRLPINYALLIFLPLVAVSIWAGKFIPVNLPISDPIIAQKAWGVLILVYCLIASVLPMWSLLQPRGLLGGYFLYISLAVAAIGLIFGGYEIQYPAFLQPGGESSSWGGFLFPMFPVLFITIACGACSGFHALVSSGTTCKQLSRESEAKPVAYGAMLLEGLVAVISVAMVMVLTRDSDMASKSPNFIYASGIGRFMELIGISPSFGITFGLMAFTTFVYDTLDVTTRLGRYIVEELTGMHNWWVKILGTFLTAGVPILFIFQTLTDSNGNPVHAWRIFWNTFGASNQLLAALSLIAVTIWLLNTRKKSKVWLVAFVPAVIMFIMSVWALLIAMYEGWVLHQGHFSIPYISLVLIILALLVAYETLKSAVMTDYTGRSQINSAWEDNAVDKITNK